MTSMTSVAPDDRLHLQRLIASWGIVADFCFGDLLLFVPVDNGSADIAEFIIFGQVRPTTSRTLYHDDLVGRAVNVSERPLLLDAFQRSTILDGQNFTLAGGQAARVEYVPVVRIVGGLARTIAVLTHESEIDVSRRPGRLERVYVDIFGQMASMIANGLFPFDDSASSIDGPTEAPRVGDGVIAIDTNRIITYASPNAVSALHRLGLYANAEGRSLRRAWGWARSGRRLLHHSPTGAHRGGADQSANQRPHDRCYSRIAAFIGRRARQLHRFGGAASRRYRFAPARPVAHDQGCDDS